MSGLSLKGPQDFMDEAKAFIASELLSITLDTDEAVISENAEILW